MAGLLDMIQQNRANNLSAHAALGQQKAQQAAAVRGGAFNTVPPGPPEMAQGDAFYAQQPGGVTPQSQEVNETGQTGRLLEAGTHDLAGGVDNALAAAAAAVGQSGAFSESMRRSAQEHAQRAEQLTPDQPKSFSNDVHGPGDFAQYVFGQAVRGAPMLGAMAAGGVAARSLGAPALAGVAAPSAVLNTGSAYGEMADQPGVDPQAAGQHALAAGGVNAVLDSLAFGYASKLSPFAKGELAKAVSSKFAPHVLASLATEAGSGAAREAVNQVAVKHLLGNPDLFKLSDADKTGLIDAAAQNAAATAPLGVAGHFGRGLANGVDKTIDAAGGLYKRVADAPGAIRAALPGGGDGPSIGTKMGRFAAAVADSDPAKLKEYGSDAVDALQNIPGVKSAMDQGRDFMSALGDSRRVGKISSFLEGATDQVRGGFDAFREGLGETAKTDNIEEAFSRYKTLLAHSIGAEGIDGAALGRLSGEKLGSLIAGFNEKLPAIESATGAVFKAAGHVADEAAFRAHDVASSTAAGAMSAVRSFNASRAESKAAAAGIADQLQPKTADGTQQSLSSPLTPEQRQLNISLRKDNAGMSISEGVLLSKIFEPLAGDNKAFDEALAKPGVAQHIATLTDMTPQEFKQYVHQELGRRMPDPGEARSTKLEEQGALYDAKGAAVEGTDQAAGEHLSELDTSDLMNEMDRRNNESGMHTDVDNPNDNGVDNHQMTPEAFGKMLVTQKQLDDGHTGNAVVNVTRTGPDGTTTEPKKINFMNVATAWRDHTKANTNRGSQRSMDDNFKQGLAALLNGWSETDEHGNKTDVTIQPAKGKHEDGKLVDATDRDSLQGWLRGDSTVGFNRGKVRTFGQLEKSGRENRPPDVHTAISQYYDSIKGRDDPATKAGAADKVANEVVDSVRTRLDNFDPAAQQRILDRSIKFVMDPHAFGETSAAIKMGVPPELATLPPDILHNAKSGLLSRLSDLEQRTVQDRQKGEHETSVDNEDYNAEHNTDQFGDAKNQKNGDIVHEDMAGDHISYNEDQKAGAGKVAPSGTTEPASPPRGGERPEPVEPRQPGLGLDDPTQPLQAGMERVAGQGSTGGVGDKPYAEAKNGTPKEQAEPSAPLQGKLDVNEKQPVQPVPAQREAGPRGDAMNNLKRLYARQTTEAGKNLLRAAMDTLLSDRRVSDANLALLSKADLRPSDLRAFMRPTTEGAAAKKAKPA